MKDTMDHLMSNTRRFLEVFKAATLWQRLFHWSFIRSQSYVAHEEIAQFAERMKLMARDSEAANHKIELLQQENRVLLEKVEQHRMTSLKLDEGLRHLESDTVRLENEKAELRRRLEELLVNEKQRTREFDDRFLRLTSYEDNLRAKENALEETRQAELRNKIEAQKETWKRHEENVKNQIRAICDQHAIEYIDEVPFRGKPDNVIRICDEYIVFDAKSPASDDLGNFNTYIRTQAEAVKKYVSGTAVRKDVYLVVPTSTVHTIRKLSFDLGAYHVFVITTDALEPVILSMKKIEAYEFAEQMSPEDRQSICRVVGGLIYASKRRIQVDQFFNGQILSLLAQTQREIPDALQEEIGRHEKAMKLNPEIDRRSKEIRHDILSKKQAEIEGHAKIFQISTPATVQLDLIANG